MLNKKRLNINLYKLADYTYIGKVSTIEPKFTFLIRKFKPVVFLSKQSDIHKLPSLW